LLISSNKSPAYNLANIFGSLVFFFEELTLSFPSITFLGHKTHTMAPSADGAPPVSIAISHELPDGLPPNSRRSQPIKPLTSGYSLGAADGH